MPSKKKKEQKKEKYIHRWLKKHPVIKLYVTKEEHDLLMKIANEKQISVKQLIVNAIKGIKENYQKESKESYNKGYKEGVRDGYEKALQQIIENPELFYNELDVFMKAYDIEQPIILAELECSKCGTPYVITHKDIDKVKLEFICNDCLKKEQEKKKEQATTPQPQKQEKEKPKKTITKKESKTLTHKNLIWTKVFSR